MLGAESAVGPLAEQRIPDVARWGVLPEGATLRKGDSLFPRLEEPTQ
jgi:methionyl-tRNA synthetase